MSTWQSWAPLPAALVSAWFLVIVPRSHQLSLPGIDTGRDRSCSVAPWLAQGWGLSMGFFSPVPPASSLPLEWSLGAQEWQPPLLPFLCAYQSKHVGLSILRVSSSLVAAATLGEGRGIFRHLMLAWVGCLPSQNSKCEVRLVPMPSGAPGAAGGYFCSRGGKGTRVQLPRAFLCVGLYRRSEVRVE